MMKNCLALVIASLAFVAAPAAADEKLDRQRLPRPLENIAFDVTPLEKGGRFTVIDVRFEEVEEGRKGVVWTLKANEEIKCAEASRFFKGFYTIRYYREIKDSYQEVTWGWVHLPGKVSLLLGSDTNVIKRNESIDIWVDAGDDLVAMLKSKKATKAEFTSK